MFAPQFFIFSSPVCSVSMHCSILFHRDAGRGAESTAAFAARRAVNLVHCQFCYCYVCDTPTSGCAAWSAPRLGPAGKHDSRWGHCMGDTRSAQKPLQPVCGNLFFVFVGLSLVVRVSSASQ